MRLAALNTIINKEGRPFYQTCKFLLIALCGTQGVA
jgi:hypothetical protein